jgi:hypothetical protein
METLEALFRHLTLRQTAAQIAVTMGCSRNAVVGLVKRARDAGSALPTVSDAKIKAVLDCLFVKGQSAETIAKLFGIGRVQCLWIAHVVMHDLALAGPGAGDAVAWPSWWRPVPQTAGVAA